MLKIRNNRVHLQNYLGDHIHGTVPLRALGLPISWGAAKGSGMLLYRGNDGWSGVIQR